MTANTDFHALEEKFSEMVKLSRRPVSVAFLDAVPDDVKQFEGTEPSGCSFWRLAAAGNIFYTVPENHFNCAVGAYTTLLFLPSGKKKQNKL